MDTRDRGSLSSVNLMSGGVIVRPKEPTLAFSLRALRVLRGEDFVSLELGHWYSSSQVRRRPRRDRGAALSLPERSIQWRRRGVSADGAAATWRMVMRATRFGALILGFAIFATAGCD